jgi:hypothetical protein
MADLGRALISKIIASEDIETAIAAGIETSWFEDPDPRKVFDWMLQYHDRYGQSPTAEALKREYPTFQLLEVPEPYQYYVDKFKSLVKRAVAADAVIGASEALDSDDPVRALDIMAQATQRGALVEDKAGDEIASVLASEITPRSVRWIWPGRIPRGKLTIVAGDSGQGKTTMVMNVVARLSSGRTLPCSKTQHQPMKCLIMTAEDDLADTLVPRLIAAGADLGNVEFITGHRSTDALLSFPKDIDLLRSKVLSTGARLLVIDPFNAFLDGKTDSYRDADIRRVLAPLSRLAEDTGVAVLLIFHLKKSQGGKAIHQIVGSVGIGAAARAVLLVAPNPEDEDERLLAVSKMSNASTRTSLAFRIDGSEPYDAAKAVWLRQSKFTADQLVNTLQSREDSALAAAESFLTGLLIKEGGQMPVNEIRAEAMSANVRDATLRRAKESLGVLSKKSDAKQGNVWIWYLQEQPANPAPEISDHLERLDHLGETELKSSRKRTSMNRHSARLDL